MADAGWLACDLIEAGLDTPAVWDLPGYVLSIGSMQEVEPLVRQLLTEIGSIVLIDDGESLRGTPPTDDELREQARKIAHAAPGWPDAKADQEP
ncbi:hypothetical protein [Nonomuraea wenchangensis]|uniref:hypothetical protein n=1 Tax=Nonomuraea wenchangensis TaxID=568860 RepID=UPI00332695E3